MPRKFPQFFATVRNFSQIWLKVGYFYHYFWQLTSTGNAYNTSVFQALNSPSTHQTKYRALILILCQNIAVPTTS